MWPTSARGRYGKKRRKAVEETNETENEKTG